MNGNGKLVLARPPLLLSCVASDVEVGDGAVVAGSEGGGAAHAMVEVIGAVSRMVKH